MRNFAPQVPTAGREQTLGPSPRPCRHSLLHLSCCLSWKGLRCPVLRVALQTSLLGKSRNSVTRSGCLVRCWSLFFRLRVVRGTRMWGLGGSGCVSVISVTSSFSGHDYGVGK